jgi:hypothetical protein
MFVIKTRLQFLGLIVLLSSCAAQQVQLKSPITLSVKPAPMYVLQMPVTIRASNSAATHLRAGTTWSLIGAIEQGNVYGTKDQVVIINSFNVHEAFIVVRDNKVVGYYLPVEKTFVKSKPVDINLIRKEMKDEA